MIQSAPANVEAEAALLGSILIDPERLEDAGSIAALDFHLHSHAWVWDAIAGLNDAGQPVDVVTVGDELARAGHLSEVGGAAFLLKLMDAPGSSVNAGGYAEIVRRESLRRRLLEQAAELAKAAVGASDPAQAAGKLAQALEQLAAGGVASPVTDAASAVDSWYDRIADYLKNGKIAGITTGFADIDRVTQGLKRGELMILAARPSMGKTSMSAQMSARQAKRGLRVGVFTLEESRESWIETAALAHLGIDKYHAGPDALTRITEYCNEVYSWPMRFYERGFSSMAEIDRAARRMARELGGLDILWLDHLGYVDHFQSGEKSTSLPYLIGQSTKRLAALAKEFDCAVACLCQLSRASAITKAEPQLTDLRDSGEIEQDARQVWFIHRPGYYADPEPPAALPQEARLLVRKNHEGPTGLIPLMFTKSVRRFSEVAK